MNSAFYDWQDYGEQAFKALIPNFWPIVYQKYASIEQDLLIKRITGSNLILEAGVGIGRLIPILSPHVGIIVGVDNSSKMIEEANVISQNFKNVVLTKLDLKSISNYFPVKYFDFSLCMFNTIGNFDSEIEVLKELKKITKRSIVLTTYLKDSIPFRKDYYQKVGVEIEKIDEQETFYSKSGLISKSYSQIDIARIASLANLYIRDSLRISDLFLWTELVEKSL